MINVVLDGFGGDHSPQVNVEGAVWAVNENKNLKVIITGDESILKSELAKFKFNADQIEIVHASEVIYSSEVPTQAIRQKKDSSLVKALNLVKEREDIAGMVSIGSTGATLAGAVLKVGRLKQVIRPGFCPIVPTMNHSVVGICDSGANVDCDVRNYKQFAIMGSIYMACTWDKENPRVALLNIGTEEEKGNQVTKEAYQELKNLKSINFVGNMESRDLLAGNYDLIVSDGFSGNVLLKSTEGTAMEMMKLIKKTFKSSFKNKLGALFLKKSMYDIKDFMDYNNYGGGIMLGIKKIVIKGHGSSKSSAVKNCLLQAYKAEENHLCQTIEKALQECEEIDVSIE